MKWTAVGDQAAGVAIALVDLVVEASRPCTEGAIAVDGAHGGECLMMP